MNEGYPVTDGPVGNEQPPVFGDIVEAQLWQRIPAEAGVPDELAVWKDTGKSFTGTLVNGPDAYDSVTGKGEYWYVMPDQPYGRVEGNGKDDATDSYHPVQLTGREYPAVVGEGSNAYTAQLRFVVTALHRRIAA